MITLHGRGVYGGIAMGNLFFHRRRRPVIGKSQVQNTELQLARFWKAHQKAIVQLKDIYKNAVPEVGRSSAMIFHTHQMILEDMGFTDAVIRIITEEKVNAEYAVMKTSQNLAGIFEAMEDPYMRARASDMKDVAKRILEILTNQPTQIELPDYPVILAADDLVPSETVQLDKSKVLAFVTMGGSPLSHTAILARNMDIPAVISVGNQLQECHDGATVIVDGFQGEVFLNPTPAIIERLTEKKKKFLAKRKALQEQVGKENITLDGQTVRIAANIGNASHVHTALQNDADGIGLFRSEFLYLENDHFPSEEQQLEVYRSVLESMGSHKVVIRTMDIGADKQAPYFHLPQEENPAMGYRAIRICLSQPEIFRTQLRALYRASAFGNLAILFPMITSMEEIRAVKQLVSQVKEELKQEKIPYSSQVELGIMIETPAAALISDQLAKEVDFFSIGTNDLTQYLLAIDRQNAMLERFYLPRHPAVLRTIDLVTQNAHKNGIWVGICGELGGDLELTETFLALGIDELSVSPSLVLPLRKKVRETNVKQIRTQALAKFR
ncbi:MAG: phosphoenolpyruvate--protein phosphotransferase [Clostridiales bacterium]|jgi:phosphotransferase system enzyme I (PtsI)|nr:phosphoenolpyruvate--protein phosphotransferase [Clostridiales bacterium]